MGVFANTVKQVESRVGVEKVATEDPELAKEWAAGDKEMEGIVPSPAQSAFDDALNTSKYVAGAGIGIAGLLAVLRHLEERDRDKRVLERLTSKKDVSLLPGKDALQLPIGEKHVPVKFASDKKAGILDAISEYAGKGWEGIKDIAGKISEPVRGAGWSSPYGAPMILGSGVLATMGGSALFDAVLDKLRDRRRQRELEEAEGEFQEALATQYSSSKKASVYNVIDGLAEAHASGELNKQLDGFNKAADGYGVLPAGIGLYLTALMILAGGGASYGYGRAKDKDTDRKRSEALERAIMRRGSATPPQFVLNRPNEMDEEPV